MQTLCGEIAEVEPVERASKASYSEAQWNDIANLYITGQQSLKECARQLGCEDSTVWRRANNGSWGKRRSEYLEAKLNKPTADLVTQPINTQFPELQRELLRESARKLTEAQVRHYEHLDIVQRQIRDIDQELSACKDGGEKATLRKSLDMMLERQRIMLRIPGPPSSKMSEAPTMKTVPDSDNVEVAMLPGAPE